MPFFQPSWQYPLILSALPSLLAWCSLLFAMLPKQPGEALLGMPRDLPEFQMPSALQPPVFPLNRLQLIPEGSLPAYQAIFLKASILNKILDPAPAKEMFPLQSSL